MNNKQYDSLVMLRGYNTKLVEKAKGVRVTSSFDRAYDRMLYCRVRGCDQECELLFNKITNLIKEII